MSEIDDKITQLVEQLRELLEPVVQSEGMELVDLEYRRESHGMVLRLFIDKEGGVSVNDCAKVSQVVGDLLDVSDLIAAHYHLEVSSPGLDRVLRKVEHFEKQIGNIINVKTTMPIEKRRRFKGILVDTKPEGITVNCEGQLFEIPLALVERAKLCYFESIEK
jgi:ribosome maturation factor RimP